ncbi:hypothetical protein [Paraburkholderia acidiphila]|uniref:Uncharacterized protein n=1 Tax=Paraburkholderia acidiphila TaxID=2571747 RepID=A0A7Z2J8D0_9BURK|nr:hypothetical protein [Paraburkholderia acidiphila]QGZ55086.1 hypothetical protein FAZ97_09240 [Paraburkholderia acidiphila]
MTVVALWYSGHSKKLMCAADSRFSRGKDEHTVRTTDSGPKIFPLPVVCREEQAALAMAWPVSRSYTFGFAYAGTALPALSTFALASACAQNLCSPPSGSGPVSVESVAELFREVADRYIREMSETLGVCDEISSYYFTGLIFGFCPVRAEYAAYKIQPWTETGLLEVRITPLPLGPGDLHLIGSGASTFLADSEKRRQEKGFHDPIKTLKAMLGEEWKKDVGGHIQYGECRQGDFRILPLITPTDGDPARWPVGFLGWDVSGMDVSGYSIGYNAIEF